MERPDGPAPDGLGLVDAGPVAEPPAAPEPAGSELVCRQLTLRDLPSLLGDFEIERYQLPESLVAGRGLLMTALASFRPLSRGRPRTIVGLDQGRVAAFVQFQPVGRDRRWVALGAGYLSNVYSPEGAVEEVLRHAVLSAGQRGVKRLYARLHGDAELADAYRRVGFQPFTAETIWAAERLEVGQPGDDAPAVREQEVTDTWAVHQLYNASAPRDVQYAEAFTSARWELQHQGRRGSVVRGYLLEDGFRLTAYGRTLTCGERHHAEFMFDPDSTVDRAAVIRAVLGRTEAQARLRQVFVTVRAYQQELEGPLERLGFRPRARQRCTVRYTAARVEQPATVPVGTPVLTEVRERVPKQVPTFLRRRPPGRNPAV